MPHAANTTTLAPFAKLVDLGDQLVGAWGGSTKRQATKFGTTELLWKGDGEDRKPRYDEINWFIVMPTSTAKTGGAETGYEMIEPGSEVRWSFSGWKWGQAIQARRELPAVPNFSIGKGREASSDVYTIKLVGRSAATENAEAAVKAGFTVVDKRIVMSTDEEHEKWVLAMIRQGKKDLIAASDYEITIRRADYTAEAQWVELADALFERKPWEYNAASSSADNDPGPGPFDGEQPTEGGGELPEEPF